MSNFPDFIGDRVWALAWVMVDQKQYPNQNNISAMNYRAQIMTSNNLMNFIALEEKIKPKVEAPFNHHKRHASGLEMKLGNIYNEEGINSALDHAISLIEKYTDFRKLKIVSEKNCKKPLRKSSDAQVRKFLILESDCF